MADSIIEFFDQLLVDPDNQMRVNFLDVSSSKGIDGTGAYFSCHMVRVNSSGKDRVQEIANFVSAKIIDYAIPKTKRREAQEHLVATGSSDKYVALMKEAKSLFTDIKNSGEGGEILLYVFANAFLKIPQVLCKMPLKTNPQVHYHGVDGLHAKHDKDSNQLLLYWGESKIYSDLQQAFTDCFDSISNLLLSDGSTGAPAERDLQLFRDNIDLDNEVLEKIVLSYLDPSDENNLRLVHCGICLIGFDEEAYKNTTEEAIKEALEKRVASWELSRWKMDDDYCHRSGNVGSC